MTCIIGLLDKGICYIGGDTCGSDQWTYINCNHSKVFRVKDFIIGGTSSFRMLDLLEYSLNIPLVEQSEYEDMDKFMRTIFINAVRQCLKDNGFAKVESNVELGGTFLVGYKDRLWEIQDDLAVLNVKNYGSCGCGREAAIGSMFTTKDMNMKPEDRIIKGLEAAESYSPFVKAPFNILSTGE